MSNKPERDVEVTYSVSEFADKLRRLADSLESGKPFEIQIAGLGFSLVEVLSICPTNWGMTPLEAVGWMEHNMMPYYPLGTFRTGEEVAK